VEAGRWRVEAGRRRCTAGLQGARSEWLSRTREARAQISTDLQAKLPNHSIKKGKDSPYSITERRIPELIPVLGSQPAGDVSHKPGGRLALLSASPTVTPATLKKAATEAQWV